MNKSVNSVFAQMAVDVGLEEVKGTAVGLGMNSEAGGFGLEPAMSLGVMGASPLDMAGVYATLDNHGRKVTPRLVKSAVRGEESRDLPDPPREQVVDRATADSVTSVLTGVVDDGTGRAVRSDELEVAGKTGTSDDNKSAWFAGYTPRLATVVGLFGERTGRTTEQVSMKGAGGGGRVNGGGYPARIWSVYTEAALNGEAATAQFDLEPGRGAAVTPVPTAPPSTGAPDSPAPQPTYTFTSEPPTTEPGPAPSETDPGPTFSVPEPPPSEPTPTKPPPGPTFPPTPASGVAAPRE
jgi:membrane peptidoglycan carboxypeptidase